MNPLSQASLFWDNVEQFNKAVADQGSAAMRDIPNFSNLIAVILVGKEVAESI
jgi:hypothetical protein